MTFDKFKVDLLTFLDNSIVNLGRSGTKTRSIFMATVTEKLNAFADGQDVPPVKDNGKDINSANKNIIRIKPSDKRRSLDIGKGVHSMTASESARADEQLGRSPYSVKHVVDQKGGDKNDN